MRGSPTLCCSRPLARASTFSPARAAGRSKRGCADSASRDQTRTQAIAIWRETCRPSARAPAWESCSMRYGATEARPGCSYGRSSPSHSPSGWAHCTERRRWPGSSGWATRSGPSPIGSRPTANGSIGRRRFSTSLADWRSRSTYGARSGSRTCFCAARGCSISRPANGAATSISGRRGSINASPR